MPFGGEPLPLLLMWPTAWESESGTRAPEQRTGAFAVRGGEAEGRPGSREQQRL